MTGPYGLLNPLEIHTQPWDAIGIDFVGPLPESKNRDGYFNAITTIIDLFSGMVHLVPSRIDYTAKQVAELVFSEVYKHHGLPRTIVSDRDPLFTSHFWQELHILIGTKLRMSSAFHPETDGATERANKTLGQMLRVCISPDQKDWVARLPAIEFAINSARSESTGYAPFYLNTGRTPRLLLWAAGEPSGFPGVRAFAKRMRTVIMGAHDCLIAARVKSTRNANRKRVASPFAADDFIYLSTKNITLPKGMSRKLAPKFVGPYPIIEDFGNQSYRLKLPLSLKKQGVHDVFHSSLLRIHIANDDKLFPGRLDSQVFDLKDLEGEWAVEKVLEHKLSAKKLMFKVLFKSGDSNWLEYEEISHLIVTDQYLEAMGIEKPSTHNEINLPLDTLASVMIETESYINQEIHNGREIYSTSMENSPVNVALPPSKCPTPEWTDPNDHDAVDYGTEDDPGYYGSQPGEDPVDGPCGDVDAEGELDGSELAVAGTATMVVSTTDGDKAMDTEEAQAPIEAPVAPASILAPVELNVAALSLSESTHTRHAHRRANQGCLPTLQEEPESSGANCRGRRDGRPHFSLSRPQGHSDT